MPNKRQHKLKSGSSFRDCPTVVYPKEKMEAIERILKECEEDISNQKAYTSVEEMFADMGIDIKDL